MNADSRRPSNKAKPKDFILALFVALLAGVTMASLIWATWSALKRADPQIAATILTAAATVLVGTITVVGGRVFERRKMIEASQREQWAGIYEEFINDWMKIFGVGVLADERYPVESSEMVRLMADFSSKLMIWGSDRVLAEWILWRKVASEANSTGQQGSPEILVQLEKVILAMRKDLGHKDRQLKPMDILRLFINDIDGASLDVPTE